MKRKPTMDAFNMCLALLLLPGLSIAQTDLLQVRVSRVSGVSRVTRVTSKVL